MRASTSTRSAPRDVGELMTRADALAGQTLADIARSLHWPVPEQPVRAKGWAGQLIEAALGASAGSRPAPDFEHLGIELKTLPVRPDGRPRESTFVCNVELDSDAAQTWEDSRARHKLAHVLWIPIVTETGMALGPRCVGMPLLWRPGEAELARLRADWEELMEIVCLGGVEHVSAEHGDCLQLRPKGANNAARTAGYDASGARVPVLPLGFYLRASFTAKLLQAHYALGTAGLQFRPR